MARLTQIPLDADAIRILNERKELIKKSNKDIKTTYSSAIRDLNREAEKADKKYNGWSNYETWCINLWLGNDSGSYEYWKEIAKEIRDSAKADNTFSKKERSALTLMKRLKNEIEERNPLNESASLYSDLMNAVLSEVNYHEIAEHMINDLEE